MDGHGRPGPLVWMVTWMELLFDGSRDFNPIPTMAILGNSWILKVLTLFGNFVLEGCFICNGMFQSSLQVSKVFQMESSAKLTKGTV